MDKKVSTNFQSFESLVETTKTPAKLLKDILSNNDSLPETITLLYALSNRHEIIHLEILNFLKEISSEHDYAIKEWTVKILFIIFEKSKKKNENKSEALKILQKLKFDFTNFIINLLNSEENIEISKEIIKSTKFYAIVPELVKEIKRNSENSIVKNASMVLVDFHQFLSSEDIEFMCESEHFSLRNCYLDILYSKTIEEADKKENKENENYVYLFMERLSDVNHFVRNKALHYLGLLMNDNYLRNHLNEVLVLVCNKIFDRTSIVRKKAICFFSNFLIKNDKEIHSEQINEILNNALQKILDLLSSKVTTEVLDIIHFIKLSYFYKVKNSKIAFESLFDLIWDSKTKKIILESIKEIIERSEPIDFFYSFCSENESYKKTLKSIKFKKNWILKIQNDFFKDKFLYESTFVLSNIRNVEFDSRFVDKITLKLFKSASQEELVENCKIYKNVLKIILKCKKCKCIDSNCEECFSKDKSLLQISKNLSKLNFIEYEIIDLTTRILFRNKNFEKNILSMINLLNNKEDYIKIIYALGTICSEINLFLENVEKNFKDPSFKIDKTIKEEIKEKRNSFLKKHSINNTFIENTVIENTMINNSIVDCTFVKGLKEKDKDEVSDFIFYLKEKEIVYNVNSLIREYLPILYEMLNDNNFEIQNVAYLSLYKIMLCSSEFFLENFMHLEKGLKSKNFLVRNTSIFALAEFIPIYSAWIESMILNLFEFLCSEENENIKKNCAIIIYKMLTKKLIKLKGQGKIIIKCIKNEIIGNLIRKIVKISSENEISNMIYETLSEEEINENILECVEVAIKFIDKEKIRESLCSKIEEKKSAEEFLKIKKIIMS
ncbi:condensin complex non-SMC subunit Cnd1 [Gurleya vavrai]